MDVIQRRKVKKQVVDTLSVRRQECRVAHAFSIQNYYICELCCGVVWCCASAVCDRVLNELHYDHGRCRQDDPGANDGLALLSRKRRSCRGPKSQGFHLPYVIVVNGYSGRVKPCRASNA